MICLLNLYLLQAFYDLKIIIFYYLFHKYFDSLLSNNKVEQRKYICDKHFTNLEPIEYYCKLCKKYVCSKCNLSDATICNESKN